MKKKIISAICTVIMLCVMVMNVSALEEPDMSRTGSISISMSYNGEVVPSGSLTIYRIADVHLEADANYSYSYTDDYAECQASLNMLKDPETAKAIAEYTQEKGITGTKVQIDEKGNVKFDNLQLGLYLIVQEDAASGYEAVNPFLVSVPGGNSNGYIYDVDASPKVALEQKPTPPPPDNPPPPDIPQTGLNQWPIPVLAISGLILIALGLIIYSSSKMKAHES